MGSRSAARARNWGPAGAAAPEPGAGARRRNVSCPAPLYRSGFGGTLGPGGQWFSWIHINDAARLILHALDQETITGPLISASPNPVTSREFAKTFAHTLHRPRLFPMPRWMMKLMWGERADLFLDSHRTVPQVALSSGFQFRFPTLSEALSDLLAPNPMHN